MSQALASVPAPDLLDAVAVLAIWLVAGFLLAVPLGRWLARRGF